MKVLVTGGAGFIGSNIVDRLLDNGLEVAVIDDFSTGSADNLKDATDKHGAMLRIEEADIRDKCVIDILAGFKPDCVFHLAAQMDVRKSVADPVFDADVNISGTLNVLEACVKTGVTRFIFTSSGGAVYAEPQYLPVDEDHPKQPLSPYGISKKVIGDYLEFYMATHGLSPLSLALGNVYGPRQDPYGEAGVVAIFVGQMLSGQVPTVNGDGEQVRDYVFVDDVVDAFMAAMGGTKNGFYNIGTGVGTSVNGLYQELAGIIGFTHEPVHGPAKPGEMRQIFLDCSLAQMSLGWTAKTSMKEGLSSTVQYFRSK